MSEACDAEDKESLASLWGSRESLVASARPCFPKSKKPSLKLKLGPGPPTSKPPASPRPERKSEPRTPVTPSKESAASHLYHKSFSDLHKGLDNIFKSASRPPSRASNFGDHPPVKETIKKDSDSGYLTMTIDNSLLEAAKAKEGQDKSPPKTLVKSLSRKNLYDDEPARVDDCDVYHTITGGRTHALANTRSILPFSKITRRPLHKVLAMTTLPPKIDDGDETESLISLGEAEPWPRVNRHEGDITVACEARDHTPTLLTSCPRPS